LDVRKVRKQADEPEKQEIREREGERERENWRAGRQRNETEKLSGGQLERRVRD